MIATRFPIRLRNVGLANQTIAMNFLRQVAKNSSLNVTVFHEFFIFADQYDSILSSTIVNIACASAAVIVVSLLLIPRPLCSIWVSVTIASINVGIFGYMSLWGVKLDFVSMVTIIMSIGFCVDFSAHIAYHFAKDRGLSSQERIRSALHSVGVPILQSALSTILGILVLIVVDNYVYRSFLKTVFLVILLGAYHGLVVLPVLLTLVYCEPKADPDAPLNYHKHYAIGAMESDYHYPPGIFPPSKGGNLGGNFLKPAPFFPNHHQHPKIAMVDPQPQAAALPPPRPRRASLDDDRDKYKVCVRPPLPPPEFWLLMPAYHMRSDSKFGSSHILNASALEAIDKGYQRNGVILNGHLPRSNSSPASSSDGQHSSDPLNPMYDYDGYGGRGIFLL